MPSSTEQRGAGPARLVTTLEAELARAGMGPAAALLLFDLDAFAAIVGGDAGDGEVHRLADAIGRALPNATTVPFSRDGFAVIAELELAQAILAADVVRTDLAQNGVCRVSVGVVPMGGSGRHAVSPVVWSAQEALQQAKSAGGDRVVVGRATPMVLKSTYFPRAQLERLSRISDAQQRTEASLLREALEHLLAVYER